MAPVTFLQQDFAYVLRASRQYDHAAWSHEFKFFHLHGNWKIRPHGSNCNDGYAAKWWWAYEHKNQDALLSFDNYPDITALRNDPEKDTQTLDPAVFDVAVLNESAIPGSIMRQETMEMLGRFDLGHKKKSLPLEVLGLERSIHLKPGGRMAIVLPEHMMKGKSAAFVRKWLYGVAHIKAIFFFPKKRLHRLVHFG